MDQENLVLEGGAESSNTVQDVTRLSNVNENVSELNVSTESTSPSLTNFSVSSESNLFVPSKLHSDILKLKTCYTDIIKLIDPYKNSPTSLENPNVVLMLNKEQMLAGIKKNKMGAEGTKVNLVNLLECVRPLCLPGYQCDTRPKLSLSTQDCDISALTSRVDSLCTQNRVDFESIKTQMELLKSTLSSFEGGAVNPHQSVPSPEPIPIPSGHVLAVEHNIPAVCTYSDNFIASNECNELFEYLNNLSIYKLISRREVVLLLSLGKNMHTTVPVKTQL